MVVAKKGFKHVSLATRCHRLHTRLLICFTLTTLTSLTHIITIVIIDCFIVSI